MSIDLASLIVEIDATDADNAVGSLDKLTAAGGKAEGAVEKVGDAGREAAAGAKTASAAAQDLAAQLQASAAGGNKAAQAYLEADIAMTQLANIQAEAKREIDAARKALDAGEISLEHYNKSVLETNTALSIQSAKHQDAISNCKRMQTATDAANDATGAQKAGLQQLGFQLGDAATMFSSGANAAQIFGTQLGQTLQAVQLMAGGTSKFAAFLGGPWGIALSVAAIALAPFIAKLFESEDAATKAANSYRSAADEARGLVGALNTLKLAEKYKELNDARSRALELETEIEKRGVRNANGQLQFVYKQQQELQKVRWQIVELNNVTSIAEQENEKLNKSLSASAKSASGAGAAHRALGASKRDVVEATKAQEDQAKRFLAILDEEMAKLKVIADQLDFKSADGSWMDRIAENAERLTKQNQPLIDYADHMERLRDIAGEIDLGEVFGRGGEALENMLGVMDRLGVAQEIYAGAMQAAGDNEQRQAAAAAEYSKARVNGTIAMLGASKRLFSEQSAGYKIISAAEKAFAALKLINTVKAMVMDTTHTASSVANSTVRATADQAAGASKMFSQLGVWAFPAVAAMIALLAGLGVKGGGGGSSYTPPSAEDMQAKIGTGTVLGDSGAQSESIANALQIMADNSNADLEYSNDQVRYLREISAGIGNLTGQIARQVGLGAGGMFSTSGLNLGTSGSSGVLGLFGSSTTRSLYDQGIDTFNQQIGDILAQGVEAQIYNIVQTVKKKSGFLGIGGGTSTSYTTTTGAIDNSVLRQFGLIIGDIQASITDMITGLAGNTNAAFRAEVENYINSMVLPGTRLSFEGMTGDEIETALNAYFSSVADTITMMVSGLAIPDLAAFQQAGEGLYETLARVTRTMATVSVALKSIGMGALGGFGGDFSATGRVTAATNLSDQFGGLDAMQEAIANFSETFLTEAERMAPVITSVRDEMARLGVAGVTTNDQFKALVQGLDLSTASGQSMFAQLLAVAPAFAKVTEYLGSLNGELVETGKTAAQLAQIEKDRRALSIQIMELTGNAEGALAAKRADQLAALDETLRPLQEQVFALQDQKTATEAAAAAAAELAAAEQRVANERSNLETRLLQLQGDTAALRERELAALDPSNRALLASIFAFEDATAAAQALADAQAEQTRLAEEAAAAAARIADERYGLETRLLQTQGDTVALRERELAALDPSNRAILSQIFALEDAKAAAEAQAAAQAEATRVAEAAAAEVIRLAEEQARIATQIANERFGLETRLLTLQGNTATLRERELAALDPSNRALQLQIYALEDQAAAATVAAQAAQEQARIEAEAAQAAKAINDQRAGLERQILELQGDTAALRALELASLDPSNRALQERIYAIRDEQAASQAAAQAAQEAAQAEAERQRALEQAASAIASEIAGLDRQLLSAQGNVEALRALDLAGLLSDEARARQLQIWAIEDAKAAADALAEANAEAARAAEELAQTERAIAEERYGLETQLLQVLGDTAALRARELEALDPSNRALQQQIWAIEDAAEAAKALADAQETAAQAAEALAERERAIAEERSGLELRLLEALGDASGALALRRAQELAGIDASNRALLEQIYAAEDAAVAAQALADAQAEAARIQAEAAAEATRQAEAAAAEIKRIADERYGLETRLLQVQGNTAALRERELAALDPSNRAILAQIFALEDQAAAAQAAAQAQDEANKIAEAAAAEATRQAEAAAAEAKRIADERYGLETQLLTLQGDTVTLRARELALLDPTNQALQQQIWAMQDAAEAATAAANAQAELARQQDEAAKAAEQLRKTGVDLQIRYFETLGDTAAATALRRREELAAADESHRSLLMQIYALEDAKTAQDAYNDALAAHNDRIEAARDQLAAAYQREAGSLQATIDKFRDFGASLRDFRAGLFLAEGGTVAGYQQAQATFLRTSAQAASGDAMALAGLAGSGTSFLEASRAQASTLVEYQRDVAMVARSVDTAIGAADQAVDYAELQLEALDRLVGGYIDLNENTVSVAQAIAELRAAQAEEVVPATVAPIVDAQAVQTQVIRDTNARLEQRIIELETTLSSVLVAAVEKLNNIDRREAKYDGGDYKRIGNDADTPLTTVTA